MGTLGDFIKVMTLTIKERRLKRRIGNLSDELDLDRRNPERDSIIRQRDTLERERMRISDEINHVHNRLDQEIRGDEQEQKNREELGLYVRPKGFGNERLGPLPRDARILTPTLQEMDTVESHNVLLVATCVAANIGIYAATTAVPWLMHGISTLWLNPATNPDNSAFGVGHVISVIYLAAIVFFRKKIDTLFYTSAMKEEQRFRMGSESWTWPQRGYSYLVAMLQWLFFSLFYPAVIIFMMWMPIPILSKLYLDTYKKTGDTEYATLVAAKFKGRFIKYFMLTVTMLVMLPWTMSLVS